MSTDGVAHLLTYLGVPRAAAREYVSRGVWLPVSWALAVLLFSISLAGVRAVWPRVEAALPGSWLWNTYYVTVTVNVGTQVLCNILLLPFYLSGVLDGVKSERGRAWPWAGGKDERIRFWNAIYKSAWLVPFNMLFVSLVGLIGIAPIVRFLNIETSFAVQDLPSMQTVLVHLLFCLLVEDAMFFCSHRLLHTDFLYKNVHKTHHDYLHVAGPASEHAHPLEFTLGNLLPVITGPLLCRAHASTMCLFLALRIAVSVEEHSGFSCRASPLRVSPWAALSAGHAYHHSHTTNVFASQFVFWDALFGTDANFNAWLEGGGKKL